MKERSQETDGSIRCTLSSEHEKRRKSLKVGALGFPCAVALDAMEAMAVMQVHPGFILSRSFSQVRVGLMEKEPASAHYVYVMKEQTWQHFPAL